MKRGFTLIELIIVLAIIGIISSVFFPNFSRIQQKAKEASVSSVAHAIQMAIESYYLNNGRYPEGSEIGITQLYNTLEASGELTKIPKNPFTTKPYSDSDPSGKIIYNYIQEKDSYYLKAFGLGNAKEILFLEN